MKALELKNKRVARVKAPWFQNNAKLDKAPVGK